MLGDMMCPPKFGDTTQKDRDGFLKGERNDVGVDLGELGQMHLL